MILRLYGDPILRKRAADIDDFEGARQLVQQLIEGMNRWIGCGLAAPQIGVLSRLFVVRAPQDDSLPEKEWKDLPIRIFINPILSDPAPDTMSGFEGCLSIPAIRAPVARPSAVTVRYFDLEGAEHQERYRGFLARVIMHENDHLNGRLFIDRVRGDQKRKLDRELQMLQRKRAHFAT